MAGESIDFKADWTPAPNGLMISGKDACQKIIVQEDWKKAPNYDAMNVHPGTTTLFTERDKSAYKKKVGPESGSKAQPLTPQ